MKRIMTYVLAVSCAAFAGSCDKPLEKDEAEAGFDKRGELPEVTLSPTVQIFEKEKRIVVTGTFSGITEDMENLEIGFMSSDDQAFSSSKVTMVENPANGTFTENLAVVPGVTNWVVAMAATKDGSVYSEKLAVDVPDVDWYYKVAEEYVGTYLSADGKTQYEHHKVTLEFSDDFSKATIYNFDPYIAKNEESYDPEAKKANFVTGTVDLKARTITLSPNPQGMFNCGSKAYVLCPIAEISDEGISPAQEFVISFSEDSGIMTLPWYGILRMADNKLPEYYKESVTLEAN